MTDAASQGRRRRRSRQHAELRLQVVEAVENLRGTRGSLSLSEVARAAGVSRDFIYDHADIRLFVENFLDKRVVISSSNRPAAQADGALAVRMTLSAEVEKLRQRAAQLESENKSLREARQRYLASQLPHAESINPAVYAELRVTNERLVHDNGELRGRIRDLQSVVSALEEDLVAARQALVEAESDLRQGSNVTAIRPRNV